MPTGCVIPDMLADIEGYKRHVIELILNLKNHGMILKEIKTHLESRSLKTFTGKNTWAIGTIGKLYNKNK